MTDPDPIDRLVEAERLIRALDGKPRHEIETALDAHEDVRSLVESALLADINDPETNLTEDQGLRVDRFVEEARGDRHQSTEIRCWIVEPNAPGNIDENVLTNQL